MIVAKIVRSAGKLSIALPDGFAPENAEFSVRKDGDAVILEPLARRGSWEKVAAWLDRAQPPLDADFRHAVSEDPGQVEDRDFHLLG